MVSCQRRSTPNKNCAITGKSGDAVGKCKHLPYTSHFVWRYTAARSCLLMFTIPYVKSKDTYKYITKVDENFKSYRGTNSV